MKKFEAADNLFSFRITDAQKEKLHDLAHQERKSASQYLRDFIDNAKLKEY